MATTLDELGDTKTIDSIEFLDGTVLSSAGDMQLAVQRRSDVGIIIHAISDQVRSIDHIVLFNQKGELNQRVRSFSLAAESELMAAIGELLADSDIPVEKRTRANAANAALSVRARRTSPPLGRR